MKHPTTTMYMACMANDEGEVKGQCTPATVFQGQSASLVFGFE